MGYEIERKFLLKNSSWRGLGTGEYYRQGYFISDKERTVRIRTREDTGILTIKGPQINNVCREYEYPIPLADATYMLHHLCMQPIIEKTRYKIPVHPFIWEIDEFYGENKGLILAEVELESSNQPVQFPSWIGKEVTGEARFYNANLIHYPYQKWTEDEKR